VNDVPPSRDAPEDVDDRYRRAAALDPSRPSDSVRRAVHRHAAQLAGRRTARRKWWQPAAVGTLAAAALAGLLMTPHFLTPTPPAPPTSSAPAPAPAPVPAPAADEATPRQPDVSAQTSVAPAAPHVPAAKVAPTENAVGARAGASNTPSLAGAQSARRTAQGMAGERDANAAPRRQSALPPRATDRTVALQRAAESGDLAGLQLLLEENAPVDARDSSGRTPLMLATLNGQGRAVDALLAHGADPNAADIDGTTPLQAAVAANQPTIAAALRRAGARAGRAEP
jgi:hypothetical protein